ncbi:MAG: hypothetical protein JSS49_22610 [Planctomycetes bacterium]|nr:hypothetical protein [Planctomycetota bacterium]
MTRFLQSGSWRQTLSAGAVCGLVLGGIAFAADSPTGIRDTSDTGKVVGDAELDAAFQTLGVVTAKTGNSSSAVRKLAIHDLPLAELSAEATAKINGVLSNVAMFRRLPTLTFEVDPEIYAYFLRNPDVAVSTWRAMEISKFQLKEVEPNQFDADAGDGSVGHIQILRQTPSETLIHCDGAFKSPLLSRPILARAVIRLQTSFSKEADGRIVGTHSGDVFVEFPSQAIETVAKVISPVSHSIADRNFKQITLYVHMMTQAMARHPGWIEQIGNKLDGVTPQERQQFMEVSARSHAMARKRLAYSQTRPFAPDDILSPFRLNDDATPLPPPVAIRPASGTARD